MRILRNVDVREVKRAFVIADLTRHHSKKHRYFKIDSQREFEQKLHRVKQHVLGMNSLELNRHISPDWPKRIAAYDTSEWYVAEMTTTELGVWRRAGGMPLAWTNESLKQTVDHVRYALKYNSPLLNKRAKRAIPGILKTDVRMLQGEKYLLPIVFRGHTGTGGRRRLKYRTKGDIDDGCMRSIALALSGMNTLRVYFGTPKGNKKLH
jgi:hypothetical protein